MDPRSLLRSLVLMVAAGAVVPASADDSAVPFQIRCDGEEFTFAETCTGRFEGVIGLGLFDYREAVWDKNDDALLERIGIRNITDRRLNYAPRADWIGLACQTTSDRLLELKGVLLDFLYSIPMNKCHGFHSANGNFVLTELAVFITPEGPRIGELEGMFRGHPDNTVVEGSFRDALVARYGAKNCDTGLALSYCRQGARSRITVQEMEPGTDGSRFWVRIKTPWVRDSAIERVNQTIEEARKKAPVNDF